MATIKSLMIMLLAIIFASGCSKYIVELKHAEPTDDDWRMAGAGPGRTSHREVELILPMAEVARFKLSSAVAKNIFVRSDFLFAPTLDGRIHTIDLNKLSIVAKKKLPNKTEGTVAIADKTLLIAMRYARHTLIHYDLSAGKTIWQLDAGDIAGEPLIHNESVYVAALYQHVDSYALADGRRRWRFKTEGQLHTSPALSKGIIVAATDRGKVYGLRAENGKKIWQTSLDHAILATPAIHDAKIFLGTTGKRLYALDLYTGEIAWQVDIQGRIYSAPAVNEDMAVFGSSDGQLHAVTPETGERKWTAEAMSVIGTTPLLAGDKIFFGSLDRHLYCLDANDGELLWRQELEGRIKTNPIVWKHHLIVASEDRYLYVFGHAIKEIGKL